ncbi:MAG: 6,7-dimethyl-8-ribityllumazine synthase [Myxococcales bacterium]|nr:6,7-dimethyl-8-ribityllumazine synthase [Myxococcales bacterium]
MPRVIEGRFDATGGRFVIVVSRFNSFITERLVEGALDTLVRHGVDSDSIDVVKVPGAYELPLLAQKCAASGRYDALVCVGALIRGSTPHFDYIASEATKGLASVMMTYGLPVAYGLLTCDTIEQAIERAGTKAGNKGAEAAMSAIEMVSVIRALGAANHN